MTWFGLVLWGWPSGAPKGAGQGLGAGTAGGLGAAGTSGVGGAGQSAETGGGRKSPPEALSICGGPRMGEIRSGRPRSPTRPSLCDLLPGPPGLGAQSAHTGASVHSILGMDTLPCLGWLVRKGN